jgi:transglutaminase-like putative cysteine protease
MRRFAWLLLSILALAILPARAAITVTQETAKGMFGYWTTATVSGTLTGTTGTEVTITVPAPVSSGSAVVLITGDVNTKAITATLRDSRFNTGEADLMSIAGTVASTRAGIVSELVQNITKDARLALPAGSYVFRLVSNDATSAGTVSGTIVFVHQQP